MSWWGVHNNLCTYYCYDQRRTQNMFRIGKHLRWRVFHLYFSNIIVISHLLHGAVTDPRYASDSSLYSKQCSSHTVARLSHTSHQVQWAVWILASFLGNIITFDYTVFTFIANVMVYTSKVDEEERVEEWMGDCVLVWHLTKEIYHDNSHNKGYSFFFSITTPSNKDHALRSSQN